MFGFNFGSSDKSNILNQAEKEYAWNWFETRGSGECSYCHSQKLGLTTEYVLLYNPFRNMYSPWVSFVCAKCGHAHLFSAEIMGLYNSGSES